MIARCKKGKKNGKKTGIIIFHWQNDDSRAKIVANSQVTICYRMSDYSNT